MADRCGKCGVEDGVGCRLVEEVGSFGWRRYKYCPTCLKRLYRQTNIVIWSLVGVGALASSVSDVVSGKPALDSFITGIALLLIFQWLMTVPHELGHAIAARALGFTNIRILIGRGPPVWSGTAMGFRWLINRDPFGGLTLAYARVGRRWKHLVFTVAGPATSVVPMVAIWVFLRADQAWPTLHSAAGILFWANALVLIENLIPYYTKTEFGWIPNDGLSILHLLLGSGRRRRNRHPPRRRVLTSVVRVIGAVAMGAATLAMAVLAGGAFVFMVDERSWLAAPLLGLLFLGLSLLSGALVWRIATDPMSGPPVNHEDVYQDGLVELGELSAALRDPRAVWELEKMADPPPDAIKTMDELLQQFPADPWLVFVKAQAQVWQGSAADALKTLEGLSDLPVNAAVAVAIYRLGLLSGLDDIDGAEQLCEQWLAGSAPAEVKVAMCDHMVCSWLCLEKLQHVGRLEKWAHRALALGPDNPAMKGTYGGLLVDMGRNDQAEAILAPLIQHLGPVDRGCALFYLGLIRLAQGGNDEARRLMRQASVTLPDSWLNRVNRKLAELDSPSGDRDNSGAREATESSNVPSG